MKYIDILLILAVVILIFVGVSVHRNRDDRVVNKIQPCEAAGWTWLNQEGKCIMVKEFK